jgi:hypothetical protein
MSSDGAVKLQYALKSLRERWELSEDGWNDKVRDDFQTKHLTPLEREVSSTVRKMHELAEIIDRMRRDCS